MVESSNIENLEINIHGEKVSHLLFTDDLVLLVDDLGEAKQMLGNKK